MHPLICQIGPFPIYSFGLMFLLAVVSCSMLLARDGLRHGITSEDMYDFIFWVTVAGLIGARLFFVGLNFTFFINSPLEILKLYKGGLAWQGGLLAGALAGFLYTRRLRVSILVMLDLVAPYLALGQAIGRLGCFLTGCCYGRPVSWGIYFPVHEARLHPTQLYDFVGLLIIFFLLKSSRKMARVCGEIFAFYLILASLERFINEFFRADHVVAFAGLSIFQLVSLGLFASGIVFWLALRFVADSRR